MANAIEPEVVESAKEEKPRKKRRAQVRFKIRGLPPPVHRELDDRLQYGSDSLADLSEWLEKEHGIFISPSSLAYYNRHELDPTLQAVKIATAQAAEIVRVSGGGDDDEMSLALFRLVQTAIFDLLVQLNRSRHLIAMLPAAEQRAAAIAATRNRNRAEDGSPDQSQNQTAAEDQSPPKPPTRLELAAIDALGKTVATVSKANLELKRWREQMREKIERKVAATNARVSQAAREGGLSRAAEKTIRQALLEIKL
jgi:Protein of unknown function (DUF3486)